MGKPTRNLGFFLVHVTPKLVMKKARRKLSAADMEKYISMLKAKAVIILREKTC